MLLAVDDSVGRVRMRTDEHWGIVLEVVGGGLGERGKENSQDRKIAVWVTRASQSNKERLWVEGRVSMQKSQCQMCEV